MMKFRNSIKMIVMAAILPFVLFSCIGEEMIPCGELIVVQRIGEGGNAGTRGTVISSNTDLKGETFGFFASLTPASSTPEQYFNARAGVNPDLTATISPEQYWPALLGASMKFFSWYPYSGTNAPTANFSNPGQMVLNYTANADAANHVDVLAALSEPAWMTGVSIHFYHTLTKVTFTFKKVDPVPDVVTIEKIEFRNVGKSGKLTIPNIPAATTEHNKPDFVWSDVTTGNIASTLIDNNTVTEDAALIGGTFLMLPTDADDFPATAKIVITTNYGEREFLLKDIIDTNPHSWESGEYINYNLSLSNDIYQLSATPLEWDESPVNVILDGQYYLKLSQTKVLTAANAATVDIEVKTNYDAIPNTGYPVGAVLDKSGMDSWATVNMTQTSVSGGVYTYNVNVVMPKYNSGVGTERSTGFYIDAGNLHHRVLLKQWGGDGVWMTWNVELDSSDAGTGIMQRRKIIFTSGSPGSWDWEITGVQDADKILLNSETMLHATGVSGDALYFYFRADAVSGDTATLTLTNPNGDNPPMTVTLTAP
ncbi:fimbrillin family protein [Bacteroides oleiciplenus]|nr:fimbrillin family protein [Bacteroides oleiciplenus]RGN31958.1 fimbrillin family protein [Bacteroides oleiciplenus]